MTLNSTVWSTGVGCVIALALWKETRERWFLSLIGMAVLAATFTVSDKQTFPLDLIVFAGGFFLLTVGKVYLDHSEEKELRKRVAKEGITLPKMWEPGLRWCYKGNHYLGPNEPYRADGDLVGCLLCTAEESKRMSLSDGVIVDYLIGLKVAVERVENSLRPSGALDSRATRPDGSDVR